MRESPREMDERRAVHSDPGREIVCLQGFFTFSVGSEDGRCECKSLAEAGGDPEKELWARRHLI